VLLLLLLLLHLLLLLVAPNCDEHQASRGLGIIQTADNACGCYR
jgi:hypothetical protein